MTYGERLRDLRAERRLSLRQVEQRGGPNKDTMSLLERGVHKPHAQTLGRIAQAFGMSVAELRAELEAAEHPLAEAPYQRSFDNHLAEESMTAGAEIALRWNVRQLAGADVELQWRVQGIEDAIRTALAAIDNLEQRHRLADGLAQIPYEIERELAGSAAG